MNSIAIVLLFSLVAQNFAQYGSSSDGYGSTNNGYGSSNGYGSNNLLSGNMFSGLSNNLFNIQPISFGSSNLLGNSYGSASNSPYSSSGYGSTQYGSTSYNPYSSSTGSNVYGSASGSTQNYPNICGSSKPVTLLLNETSTGNSTMARNYIIIQLSPTGGMTTLPLAVSTSTSNSSTGNSTNSTSTTTSSGTVTPSLGDYQCYADGRIWAESITIQILGSPAVPTIICTQYYFTPESDDTYSVFTSSIPCPVADFSMGSCQITTVSFNQTYTAAIELPSQVYANNNNVYSSSNSYGSSSSTSYNPYSSSSTSYTPSSTSYNPYSSSSSTSNNPYSSTSSNTYW